MADTKSTQKQTTRDRNWMPIVLGVGGGLVVLLLIGAVIFGSEEVGTEYGDVEVSGEPLPLMPQNQSVDISATGVDAPSLRGVDFDDEVVEIDTTDGRAKAVVFLAHWCPHCQEEVPRVQAWLDETGGVEGVDLYSVATSMNSARENFPPSDWLDGEGWSVPVLRDDEDLTALISYGAGGFPYWVFLNADGTVALRTSGQLQVEQLVEVLNTLEQ